MEACTHPAAGYGVGSGTGEPLLTARAGDEEMIAAAATPRTDMREITALNLLDRTLVILCRGRLTFPPLEPHIWISIDKLL